MMTHNLRNLLITLLGIFCATFATAAPRLHFSDLISGPAAGNTDGLGDGAIVTVWGYGLGSSQGASRLYFKDSANVSREASHTYYWKDANGNLPGGPADLYSYHQMQEIAFSIPDSAEGSGEIFVMVDGERSNSLPFTTRSGNIWFIASAGDDSTGDGSWANPWATLQQTVMGGNGKLSPGDIVYSVGIGSSSDVNVGQNVALSGTGSNPYAMVVYPGYRADISATHAGFRIYFGASHYWHFSKWSVETTFIGFNQFGYCRVVGNFVTGPNLPASGIYTGWFHGTCEGMGEDTTLCSGIKALGNEVTNYGNSDGTSFHFHHLTYMTNRSGFTAEGVEFGWNYFHDNPIWHGLHIYDHTVCGGWSTPIEIHDNVIKNNGGNTININLNCPEDTTTINLWNNITITDTDWNPPLNGAPAAAICIATASAATTMNFWNNTLHGYASRNVFETGVITFSNNVVVGNRDTDYARGNPDTYSNNLFYNTANQSLTVPAWVTHNSDPLLGNDYVPLADSPVIASGEMAPAYASVDFFGRQRVGVPDLGAVSFLPETPFRTPQVVSFFPVPAIISSSVDGSGVGNDGE